MTKNEDISNPFEATERKTLAVQNNVDKNKHLTILFLSQPYTHLDTCPKFHPHVILLQNIRAGLGLFWVDFSKKIIGVRPGPTHPLP